MIDAYIGSIALVAFPFAPSGWIGCEGQSVQISSNSALYSVIGLTFGGNGTSTFRVPDLRGRAPVHVDAARPAGHKDGVETVTLAIGTMPAHTHPLMASTATASLSEPGGNVLATGSPRGIAVYAPLPNTTLTDMAEHALEDTGAGQPHTNMQPYLPMNYVMCANGIYPPRSAMTEMPEGAVAAAGASLVGEPLIGEIRLFPFDYAPNGWALCQGQMLPIAKYQALYSLIGITYGGDGKTTFALPDLRGRVPIGDGALDGGGTDYVLGQKGGRESVALTTAEIPAHDHEVVMALAEGATADPSGNMLAAEASAFASGEWDATMSPEAVGNCIGGAAHENMMPWLSLNYCIALDGVFPNRS